MFFTNVVGGSHTLAHIHSSYVIIFCRSIINLHLAQLALFISVTP